jgi:hypothetical protein
MSGGQNEARKQRMKLRQSLALGVALGALFTTEAAPPPSGASESPDKTGLHAGVNGIGFTGFNNTASGAIVYTVPAGKRLIIESVSAFCATAPTEKVYRANVYFNNPGGGVSHHLIPTYMGPDANPNFHANLMNWTGRLYADAGAVQFGAFKSGNLSGSYGCYVAISGYLITIP